MRAKRVAQTDGSAAEVPVEHEYYSHIIGRDSRLDDWIPQSHFLRRKQDLPPGAQDGLAEKRRDAMSPSQQQSKRTAATHPMSDANPGGLLAAPPHSAASHKRKRERESRSVRHIWPIRTSRRQPCQGQATIANTTCVTCTAFPFAFVARRSDWHDSRRQQS